MKVVEKFGIKKEVVSDVYFFVSLAESDRILKPLICACQRSQISWCCFFTGKGVKQLSNPDLLKTLEGAQRAVVCEHSWHQFMGTKKCPLESGSQTVNSELTAEAVRVISL